MARLLLIDPIGERAPRIIAFLEGLRHVVTAITMEDLWGDLERILAGADVAVLIVDADRQADWDLLVRLSVCFSLNRRGPAVLAVLPRRSGPPAKLRAERLGARCVFYD